jgi:hypothetical protein
VSVDPIAMADSLATHAEALRTTLGDVKREEREAQLTLQRRNAATTAWNATYQRVADTRTGLFELAGRTELADRVRPTARRRAGLTEAEDVEGNANQDKGT